MKECKPLVQTPRPSAALFTLTPRCARPSSPSQEYELIAQQRLTQALAQKHAEGAAGHSLLYEIVPSGSTII